MRTAIYDPSCAVHGIRVVDDLPAPKPNANALLIRVKAAAINPVDYKKPHIPVMGWMARGKPGMMHVVGSACICTSLCVRVSGCGCGCAFACSSLLAQEEFVSA